MSVIYMSFSSIHSKYHRLSMICCSMIYKLSRKLALPCIFINDDIVKPQSHRIVRFLHRTIGCDRAKGRSTCTRGRAITNDWKRSMTRYIVGNRATSCSDQRPMHDHLLRPTTDRTINRCTRRPIIRSIMRLPIRGHPQLVVPPCTTGGTIT